MKGFFSGVKKKKDLTERDEHDLVQPRKRERDLILILFFHPERHFKLQYYTGKAQVALSCHVTCRSIDATTVTARHRQRNDMFCSLSPYP
ncbi:hypothetical protein DTO271D3_6387 [Paecilomyces variotii]|nr:hypothetical protein DTO169E5_3608 [Paecilomyces variotii]KAJ9271398.1 hypothetical protein DTO212C5_2478 [Paecilomyces variotii]KAJ9313328.1 hypothetical protein DTO271D3_6387 [Paecilomyces variotii]